MHTIEFIVSVLVAILGWPYMQQWFFTAQKTPISPSTGSVLSSKARFVTPQMVGPTRRRRSIRDHDYDVDLDG